MGGAENTEGRVDESGIVNCCASAFGGLHDTFSHGHRKALCCLFAKNLTEKIAAGGEGALID
jgi:hypothetical protein